MAGPTITRLGGWNISGNHVGHVVAVTLHLLELTVLPGS